MKKFLIAFVALMTIPFQLSAEEKKQDNIPKSVIFKTYQMNSGGRPHRMPAQFDIEAYYFEESNSVEIICDVDLVGEVRLYLDGNLIDYSPEVNTTFQLPDVSGVYKIEVSGSSWTVEGYLQLN